MGPRIVACGLCLLLWLPGCANSTGKHSVGVIKTAGSLKAKIDANEITVVHALDADHYAEGHIPGAINVDYEQMKPEMLPADKDTPLTFYCVGGLCPVGRMAAEKAAGWGYTKVWVYSGGLNDWQRSGMKVVKGK